MSATLTRDHRVIGGAEGARWLAAFKRWQDAGSDVAIALIRLKFAIP